MTGAVNEGCRSGGRAQWKQDKEARSGGIGSSIAGVVKFGVMVACTRFATRADCPFKEWEYAARGGNTTKYYCGDSVACLDAIAWYIDNTGCQKQDVKGKAPNAYELYDMLGNVGEWTADWKSYYSESPQSDPKGPLVGVVRIVRGGRFCHFAITARVSDRPAYKPDDRTYARGFRCCRDAP